MSETARFPDAAARRALPLALALAAVALGAVLALLGVFPGAVAGAASQRAERARAAIIGGQAAQPGQLSSVAEIVDVKGRAGLLCTGTVVAPNLVLTAGHCAEDIRTGVRNAAGGYLALTGAISDKDPAGQLSRVIGVIVYEGFARKLASGDAALLVLATPTQAPAIKLATRRDAGLLRAGTYATVAGWGLTHAASGRVSQTLRWAHTVVQTPRWCARHAWFFDRSEVCAIDSVHHTSGGCFGDSGGPLIASGPAGEAVEIGIVSHGDARCSTHRPVVFTRVDDVGSWLRTWIAAYAPSAPAPQPVPQAPPGPQTPPAPAPTQ
jgi:secreted trypsin-like serine protease